VSFKVFSCSSCDFIMSVYCGMFHSTEGVTSPGAVGEEDFRVRFLSNLLINPMTLAKSYIKITFFCRNFRRESIDTGLKVVGLIV